jgi:hypothetical protein
MTAKKTKTKATEAQIRQRVEELLRLRLDGAELWTICEYVREKVEAKDPVWGIAQLSNSQIYRYLEKVDEQIAESCKGARNKHFRRHLAQRRSLYARAVNAADYRAALAILRDEAELLCLYGGAESFVDENAREAPMPAAISGTADVVKALAGRLQQLDSVELPATEKARLTALLADALLRAIGVDVIDKRLEALQAVLAGRKDKK